MRPKQTAAIRTTVRFISIEYPLLGVTVMGTLGFCVRWHVMKGVLEPADTLSRFVTRDVSIDIYGSAMWQELSCATHSRFVPVMPVPGRHLGETTILYQL